MTSRRLAAPLGLKHRAAAGEVEQPGLERLMRFPQFAVVDRVRSPPGRPARPAARSNRDPSAARTAAASAARATTSTWTPLVMWPIGTPSWPRPGHRHCHMLRETSPCSDETALARRETLSASTVMQKSSLWLSGSTRPRAIRKCRSMPIAFAQGPKCSSIRSAEKRSWPAGTGVCVVNTVRQATRRMASSTVVPSRSMLCRINSSTANALCPSFKCTTPGAMPKASSARTPPMPSSSSWRMRVRVSPPYSRAVSSRSSGALPGTSESSKYSRLRPTVSFHTRAEIMPVRVSIETVIGSPSVPVAG